VTARDRLRFWRLYLAADPLGWAARWLRLAVRFKSWNNRRRDGLRWPTDHPKAA
jgi:hypothetical protein